MAVSEEALAWRSGLGSGDLYSTADLRRAEKVKEIFVACKAARGYITAEGWAFLFDVWQLKELLELDLGVGWFHSGRTEEHAAHLIYQSLMAGYNPLSKEKGDYESDSGLFISLEGRKHTVDWDEIMGKGS